MDFVKEMVEARRCLHKRPEEGWTEFETTWFIAKRLKALGLQVTIGKANICESEVLGRDPVLVSDAMKRAAAHGVPEDFLKSKSVSENLCCSWRSRTATVPDCLSWRSNNSVS